MNTERKPVDVLKKAAFCANCRDLMPAGTEIKWFRDSVHSRNGAGRLRGRSILVPAHTHECIAAKAERIKQQEIAASIAWAKGGDA